MQAAIEHFIAKLILPHRTAFETFKPLGHMTAELITRHAP